MNQSRGALTAQISRKRKEREDFFLPNFHANNHHVKGKQVQSHPKTTSSVPKAPSEPVWSNRFLAGYMAHEFLTKGTLLGQQLDPARAQAVPFSAPGAEPKKKTTLAPVRDRNGEAAGSEPKMKAYAEVATLLKTDGAHIPGIVNPSQLARWIQR